MEQLSDFHATPKHKRSILPLSSISSEGDPNFNIFKEKCRVTDYASTNLSQRKLIAISRAAFVNNGFPQLRTGKCSTKNQICTVFKISNPRDDWNGNAAAASKHNRKNSSALAPAMKKGKHDDDTRMEQFFGTKEGKSAVLKSPVLQKLVLGSPRLKRAFASISKKSGDGN